MNAAPVESYIEEIEKLHRELAAERRQCFLLECRCERLQARIDELEAQQPTPRRGTCARCGKDTLTAPNARKTRRFCSNACKQAYYRDEKPFRHLASQPSTLMFLLNGNTGNQQSEVMP